MNATNNRLSSQLPGQTPSRRGGWQRWTPYAAPAWSLGYAALALYWALSGRGFPYDPAGLDAALGPVVGRFGPLTAWIVVIAVGLPAAALGLAMLRGARTVRPLLICAGGLLSLILLLLMTDINLLVLIGYIPYALVKLVSGAAFGQTYLQALTKWTVLHQLLCLAGGFLWLGATFSYARRSGGACLYCGRRDSAQDWSSPASAARWGRIAVYLSLVTPLCYALTRYAWAVGIPLGMTPDSLRSGQESGMWTSGLFLASFGLVGALLTLGLTQRWGEVFPRWMVGLSGRRVPIALAVVPAGIIAVLLMIGGITILSGFAQFSATAQSTGQSMVFLIGPILLFPLWSLALAAATLGYYFRRRGACSVCGRGAPANL